MKREMECSGPCGQVDQDFLQQCAKRFKEDPRNAVVRNAIVSVGSLPLATDSGRANELSHVFLNSIKKKDLKATNQGYTGRCWMFAGLNMFRHSVIKAMGLSNFEFSESYLFFYDKIHRCETYLRWVVDNIESKPGDREFDHYTGQLLEDGGWWNCFVNLVEEYGLVPRDAMKDSWHAGSSDEMNDILKERMTSAANWMRKSWRKRKDLCPEERRKILVDRVGNIMGNVYDTMVKFMGEPPATFSWSFTNDDGEPTVIEGLTPQTFKNMILPGVDLRDFVSLTNFPSENFKYRTTYVINGTENMYKRDRCRTLNMPIDDLANVAKKSIISGMPVWFVADVGKDFHPYHSCLDDKLINNDAVFGPVGKFDKGDRLDNMVTNGSHAMAFTGINIDNSGLPVSWQVENSWGYYDNETPGEDGWLTMSHSWFKKNVVEVIVHKNYLSRTLKRLHDKKAVVLEPWNCMAPAIKASCIDAPRTWREKIARKI